MYNRNQLGGLIGFRRAAATQVTKSVAIGNSKSK